jgi:hypothetical protein
VTLLYCLYKYKTSRHEPCHSPFILLDLEHILKSSLLLFPLLSFSLWVEERIVISLNWTLSDFPPVLLSMISSIAEHVKEILHFWLIPTKGEPPNGSLRPYL